MSTKSSPPLQTKLGHKMAGTMKDNAAFTLVAVLVLRLVVARRWPWMPGWLAWLVAASPVLGASYGWLRVEHPDQADKVKRAAASCGAAIVDAVIAFNRGVARLGSDGGGHASPWAAWRERREERKGRNTEKVTDPRKTPTLREEQAAWETWWSWRDEGPLGKVIAFERDELNGTRTWTIALPEGIISARAMPQIRDVVSRGAKVQSDQVSVIEGGHSGQCIVTVRREGLKPLPDEMKHPFLAAAPAKLSIADGAPLGLTYGGQWDLALVDVHTFIGGASGSGKSVTVTNLVAAVTAMVDAEAWVIDPKQVDYPMWRNVVARYAAEPDDIVKLINELETEMRRRLAEMVTRGERKWKASADRRHIVLIIDEAADVPMALQQGKLREAARLCRSAGITLIAATQRPTRENIDATFSAQLVQRVGLRCRNEAELSYVLGDYSEDELGTKRPNRDLLTRSGDCIILAAKGFDLGRTYYLTDAEADELARRAGGPQASPGGPGDEGGGTVIPMGNSASKGGQVGEPGEVGTLIVPPAELCACTERQIQIWKAVAEHGGPLSLSAIGRQIGLDRTTIRPDVKALTAAGLLSMKGGAGGGYVISDTEAA